MSRLTKKQRGIFERPKGGGCWWVSYCDEFGHRHREKVGLRSAALDVYHQRKTEVRLGKFRPEDVQRKKVALDQILDDYFDSCKARKVHDLDCIELKSSWWKSFFSGQSAKGIKPSDLESARTILAQGFKDATINKYFSVLKAAFFLALRNGKVEKNPVCQIRMLKLNNARTRFLNDEEEERLIAVLPAEYQPMTKLAINTGLRKMELFSLQWADLNFQQRVIMVRESKSGESRTVPMNSTVMDTFKSIVRRIDSPFVFPGNLPGTHRTDLPKSWEKFLETAGIKNFVWHDLRHTFGSRLAMKGVDIYTISKLMGHKTITMTQRYAHLSPGFLHEAVNVLDRSASGTKTGTGGF
jgi:integrase